LRLDVRLLLHRLGLEKELAFLDPVALFHQDFRDFAEAVGIDVRLIFLLGFDFTRRGDNRRQVLAHHLARLHRHNAASAPDDPAGKESGQSCPRQA
jgi:hypothetical protein